MELSLLQLQKIMPKLKEDRAKELLPHLQQALTEAEINTGLRLAAFLAQIAHESDELRVFQENLNYSADGLMKTWPKRFDALKAQAYARKPEKIANYVYANRLGNGDEASGDGWKYRGSSPIQLTGRDNFRSCGQALGLDLEADPDQARGDGAGFRMAGWYWSSHHLNALADKPDFDAITKAINGGYIGKPDRDRYYASAKKILGV